MCREDKEFTTWYLALGASQVGLMVKNPPDNAGDLKHRFYLCVEKIPWRRERKPTPVFVPGKSHGQRSLGE